MHENLADNKGILVAYYAYLDAVKDQGNKDQCLAGMKQTPEQMFWISAASQHCTKYREVTNKHLRDKHYPAWIRINETFSNSKEFSRDFNCKPGSRMNPISKCDLKRR